MKKRILLKTMICTALICFVMAIVPIVLLTNGNANSRTVYAQASSENLFPMDFSTSTKGNDAGKIYWGTREFVGLASSSTQHYYTQSEDWDEEHGQVYKLVANSNAVNNAGTQMMYNVNWQKGTTYLISYWVKTSNITSGFSLTPIVLLNNAAAQIDTVTGQTNTDANTIKVQGITLTTAVTEWKQYAYTFTPNASATSNDIKNTLRFNIVMRNAGDTLCFADIQVKAVNNNLFDKSTAELGGTNPDYWTKSETSTGAVKLTVNQAITAGKNIEYKNDIAWEAGETYNITYKIMNSSSNSGYRLGVFASLNGVETTVTGIGEFTGGHNGRLFYISYNYTPTADANPAQENSLIFRVRNAADVNNFAEIYGISVVKLEKKDRLQNVTTFDNAEMVVNGYEDTSSVVKVTRNSDDAVLANAPVSGEIVKVERLLTAANSMYLKWDFALLKNVTYEISYWFLGAKSDNGSVVPGVNIGGGNYINKDTASLPAGYTELAGTGWAGSLLAWKKVSFSITPTEEIMNGGLRIVMNGTTAGNLYYFGGLRVVPQLKGQETLGAMIRPVKDSSMRMISRFSKAEIEKYEAEGYTVTLGTVFKGKDMPALGEQLTVNTTGVANVENVSGYYADYGYAVSISAWIGQIPEDKYDATITARSYIKLEKNGATTYIYGDMITRTFNGVLQSALNDDSVSESYKEQIREIFGIA